MTDDISTVLKIETALKRITTFGHLIQTHGRSLHLSETYFSKLRLISVMF